jgi:hypothetical protein
MAQQGKQTKIGAHEGFAYNTVTLISPANVNMYEVDSNTYFLNGQAIYPLRVLPYSNSDLLLHIRICSLCVETPS